MEVIKIRIPSSLFIAEVMNALSEVINHKETNNHHKLTPEFFIQQLADKKNKSFSATCQWLEDIAETNPAAAFSVVLREIAVYLDNKYEGHIEDSDKIYVISTIDGKIHELDKKLIKNYRNFAAFRTIEDAKLAINILKPQYKALFKGHAKTE